MQEYLKVEAHQVRPVPPRFYATVVIRCNDCKEAIRTKMLFSGPSPSFTRQDYHPDTGSLKEASCACDCGSVMAISLPLANWIAQEILRRVDAGEPLAWDNPSTASAGAAEGIDTYCPHCQAPMIRTGSHMSCPNCGATRGADDPSPGT